MADVILTNDILLTFAAVDVWSVGVIFLSLLAAHYPIFKAADDMEALSQIICVFGSEELKTAAKSYGTRMALSRVNTSAKAADVAKLSALNKHWITHPPTWSMVVCPLNRNSVLTLM